MILAVGAVVLLLGLWALTRPCSEVFYEGKTVRQWARQANAGDTNAVATIKIIGSNAVPDLAQMLRTRDAWWREQIWEHTFGLPRKLRALLLRRINPPRAASERAAALRGLTFLGPEAARGAIPDLQRALLRGYAYDAATVLARMGATALPSLAAAFQSKNPNVRRAVATAVGDMGAEGSKALADLNGLLEDSDQQVRLAAAQSVVILGTPGLPENARFAFPADPLARSSVLRLRLTHDPSVLPYLDPFLQMARSPDPQSRRRAVEMVGSLKLVNPNAIACLTNALADTHENVRIAACLALSQQPARSVPPISALRGWLSDSSPDIRLWAARQLGQMGAAAGEAVPDLHKLEEDQNGRVREAARAALLQIEPRQH